MTRIGEVRANGRTLNETMLKAVSSMKIARIGIATNSWSDEDLVRQLRDPPDRRLFAIAEAVRRRVPTEKIASLTEWDPFFIEKIRHLVRIESGVRGSRIGKSVLAEAKRFGFADESLSALTDSTEESVRRGRPRVAYKMVDTCGGEFEAETPYFYSTYEPSGETQKLAGRKVLIVGSGPIRIGQGVEFDYCCVQGILALREEGVAAIIANN